MSKPLELWFECEVPWDSMTETGPGRRNCGECHREVLDLSAHTKQKAEEILRRSPDLCVNFRVGMDGAPIYQRPKAKHTLAVLASGLLAACSADEPPAELVAEPAAVQMEPCLLEEDDTDTFGGPLSTADGEVVDAPSTEPIATQEIGAPAVDETTARPGDWNDTRRGHRTTGPVAGPPHPPRLGGVPARHP